MARIKQIGITGRSGSGKTTLIEKLIAHFSAQGLRVGVIKHMRHDFDIDHPGKDTRRYTDSGAAVSSITNERFMAIMAEAPGGMSPLEAAPALFEKCGLVLVEGNKQGPLEKIEVIGDSTEEPLFRSGTENILALVCDTPVDSNLPRFTRNDTVSVAEFIARVTGLTS